MTLHGAERVHLSEVIPELSCFPLEAFASS
ncbi:hypothetical protein J2129_000675 [Methanofollis sp. W23]|nr:hypothetical protein [Methanofollis sp. W23]